MATVRMRRLVTLLAASGCNLWWILALIAPSYHYQQFILFDMISIFADITLWRFYVRSNCRPYFSNWPGFSYNVKMSFDESLCHQVLKHLDGQSLTDGVTYICGLQMSIFGITDVGCDRFSMLALGSRLFVILILFSMIINSLVFVFCVVFFYCRPTLRMRSVIIVGATASSILTLFGFFFYIYIGGQLEDKMMGSGLGAVMQHGGRDSQHTSYSLGIMVAALAQVFQIGCSSALYALVKPHLCVDGKPKKSDSDEEENLVGKKKKNNNWHGDYYQTMLV